MGLRLDLTRNGIVGRYRQIRGPLGARAVAQQIARNAIGQRRFADTGRSRDHQGFRWTALTYAARRTRQCFVLAGEVVGLARMGKALDTIRLVGLDDFARRTHGRSRFSTARQTSAATASA